MALVWRRVGHLESVVGASFGVVTRLLTGRPLSEPLSDLQVDFQLFIANLIAVPLSLNTHTLTLTLANVTFVGSNWLSVATVFVINSISPRMTCHHLPASPAHR